MSPSWRDGIEAFLSPEGVKLARIRRGLRPQPDAPVFLASVGEPGWTAAVEALGHALPGFAARGAELRVTVSNHLVRYAVLPGIETLASDAERESLARHQFQAVHGERAAGWRVALAEHGTRCTGLVSALDAGFLDALNAAATAANCSLRSVEPLLAVAFNACRREIGDDSAWLAIAEPGRLCIARITGGAWTEVRNARASGALAVELPAALEQIRLTSGALPGLVHLASREVVEGEIDLGAAWQLRTVRLGAPAPSAQREAA